MDFWSYNNVQLHCGEKLLPIRTSVRVTSTISSSLAFLDTPLLSPRLGNSYGSWGADKHTYTGIHLSSTHYFWEKKILWGETVSSQRRQTMEKDTDASPYCSSPGFWGQVKWARSSNKFRACLYLSCGPSWNCKTFNFHHGASTSKYCIKNKTNQQITKLLRKIQKKKLSTIQSETNKMSGYLKSEQWF